MAISKIKTGSIEDGTISTGDIANNAITTAKIDSGYTTSITTNPQLSGTESMLVPKGSTAQRPVSPVIGHLRYNTTTDCLEQYTNLGWAGIAAPPVITSISPTTFNGETGSTITVNGANFQAGAIVTFITSGGTAINAGATTLVSSAQVTATTPQDFTVADEPIDVKITNTNGLSTSLPDALDCGGSPTWSTTSGTLGTVYDTNRVGTEFTIAATDPDSNATVTYSVTTGSLPSGMSLNTSTGVISGTPSAVGLDTTSSFTARATDNAGNTSDRSFSITIKAPVVNTYSYTGSIQTFTVPSNVTKLNAYMWAAGGSGGSTQGGCTGGSGGGGGFIKSTITNFTAGQTFNVLVGGSAERVANTTVLAYGGGGNGGGKMTQRVGGVGGGRSEISIGGGEGYTTPTGTRILVAGGGGGGNAMYSCPGDEYAQTGGAGGGTTGGSGSGSSTVPTGGTQSAGGSRGSGLIEVSSAYQSTAGSAGIGGYATGGNTDIDTNYGAGGGGGGGYWGGGGGDGGQQYTSAQSGAGGSSYAHPSYTSSVTNTQASGSTAAGTSETYYSSGIGSGGPGRNGTGSSGTLGGHGRVVITY